MALGPGPATLDGQGVLRSLPSWPRWRGGGSSAEPPKAREMNGKNLSAPKPARSLEGKKPSPPYRCKNCRLEQEGERESTTLPGHTAPE